MGRRQPNSEGKGFTGKDNRSEVPSLTQGSIWGPDSCSPAGGVQNRMGSERAVWAGSRKAWKGVLKRLNLFPGLCEATQGFKKAP